MMSFTLWSVFDSLVVIFQVIISLRYACKLAKNYSDELSILIFLLSWLFIFPIGLKGIALLPLWSEVAPLLRDYPSQYKVIPGFTSTNLLTLLSFVFVIYGLFCKFIGKCLFGTNTLGHVNPCSMWSFKNLSIIFFVLILLAWGEIRAVQHGMQRVDSVFLSIKMFIYILLGGRLAFLLVMKGQFHCVSLFGHVIVHLSKLSLLSVLSFMLLSPQYKAIRYGLPALLPSQGIQSICLCVFAILLSKKNHIDVVSRILCFIFILIPFVGRYKFTIVAYIVLLLFYLFVSLFKRIGSKLISYGVVLSFLILFVLPGIIAFFLHDVDVAISTRYFQMLNSVIYLTNQGLPSIFFGIGWGQPYDIIVPFIFDDQGAWSQDEYSSDSVKWSIQIIPFSLVRSVGLFGCFTVLLFLLINLSRSSRFIINDGKLIGLVGFLPFVYAGFLSMPDVLPESIMFSSMIFAFVFALSSYPNVYKN